MLLGRKINSSALSLDDDECNTGIHNCPQNSSCANTFGSFICDCNTGYEEFDDGCVDTDECMTHNCTENASCTNTIGSFTCDCNAGYEIRDACPENDECGSGNETSCDNIDECMTGVHACDPNASCSDTNGSYSCACNFGYVGNGTAVVFKRVGSFVHNLGSYMIFHTPLEFSFFDLW